MVQRRYQRLLVKEQQRRFPWFYQGILLWSWRSKGYPYQILYHLRGSEWFGNLGGSRILQLLFWRHRVRSRWVQHLQCSDPWPSCYQLRFNRKRSCLVWRVVRMVRLWRNPWFQVLNPWERLWEHNDHQWLRCSKRWFFPIKDRNLRDRYRLGQFRVHQKWLPRT